MSSNKGEEDSPAGDPALEQDLEHLKLESADPAVSADKDVGDSTVTAEKAEQVQPEVEKLGYQELLAIFSHLSVDDLLAAESVCKQWKDVAKDEELWKSLYISTPWKHYFSSITMEQSDNTCWKDIYIARTKHERQMNEKERQNAEKSLYRNPFARFTAVSEIDQLLNSDKKITVEDLLDMDEYVTELRKQKPILINYLRTPAVARSLIKLALEEPENCAEDDVNRRKRLPHIAFQTLAHEALSETFIQNDELLDSLFEFLNRKSKSESSPPSDATRSGYFAKITESLFEKYPTELVAYFKRSDSIVSRFVENVHDNYLMEMLFKLVDCGITHQWLHEANLVPKLVELLRESNSEETQENATQVLVNVFTLCQPWTQSVLVLDLFNNQQVANSLLQYIRCQPLSSFKIKQGLSVLISILNLITDELVDVPYLITAVLESMSFFGQVLRNPELVGDLGPIVTSTGRLDPPFGSVRLCVLELFVALLYTGYPVVVTTMADEDMFSILLDVFFKYAWNNIVHHQVVQIFSGLLCGNDDDVMTSVLKKCRLIDRIVETYAQSDEPFVGYLGHLREISNELIKVTKYSAPVAALLEGNDGWMEFVGGKLQDLNDRERRSMAGVNSISDNDSYEDGFEDEYEEEYENNSDEYEEYEVVAEGDYEMGEGEEYEEYIIEENGEEWEGEAGDGMEFEEADLGETDDSNTNEA